ncbi:AAA family ATPase [Methanobrevibacter sp.]|uniref:AAA family ATPase n=1 Tax=Methanobrevibacter sp. TaxID=66852 RepID=UPI0038901A36
MKISNIEIKNFKSFKDASIDLNDFNVVIGKSASGKSNFIEAFKFLRDLYTDFEKGILSRGQNLLQNINIKSKNPTCIKVIFKEDNPSSGIKIPNKYNNNKNNWIYYTSIEYELCIDFKDNENIINEIVKLDYLIKDANDNFNSQNAIFFKNIDGEISVNFENENNNISSDFFAPEQLIHIVNNTFKDEKGLLLNSALSSVPIPWANHIKLFEFYNLDPKFSKMSLSQGSEILFEYGDNLSYFLEKILNDPTKKKEFMNLISDLLPDIKDIDVFNLDDNRKLFRLLEKYNNEKIIGPFVSDGTVNILALISTLYFGKGNTIFIEEPERHIHPSLFISLLEMMKEVSSKNKQIIITTHSPELLDYCDLEDICLISRDSEGFSIITKPSNNEITKQFMEELSIGEIFLDGVWG